MPAVNNETFELDLTKSGGLMQALYLGQGDKNGTTIKVKITDNGELPEGIAGMVPYFEMLLPDAAHYYEVAGTLSVADGEAIATVTIDETIAGSVPGITDTAYIALKSGSTVIASTERIRVVVLRNAADGVDPAQAWNNGIEEAVARANAAAAAAEGVVLQAVPTMSATVKGGAKLGTGLEVNDDTLSLAKGVRDSIFQTLNAALSSADANWNALTAGMYSVTALGIGAPTGAYRWGRLFVFGNSSNALMVYAPNAAASEPGRCVHMRSRYGGTWTRWASLNSTVVEPIAPSQ